MRNKNHPEAEFEEGSGNVFADLGLEDGDELFTRSKIGFHVYKILKAKKLPQREIAALLGIKQPEASHLMNGHFSRFTTDKLLDFLKRLERKVTIRISRHKPGEPYQEIGVEKKKGSG
ncbi:MAG TPA: helix-turn-helix transcriptional regulator [Gemmataceae bacterium]|nr:helix-turn-helix transcriptional regulator [Gemmataceae bacterium]